MSDDSTFHFNGEDHTLGVMLQRELLKQPEVCYAAYKVPHPLTRSVEVRVISPGIPTREIVDRVLENLVKQTEEINVAFDRAITSWNKP